METPMTAIIKFTINLDWDARPHVAFFKAPDNWDDMTDDRRTKFLEEESELWADEKIERSYQVYADEDEAQADDHGWGAYYDDPEERW